MHHLAQVQLRHHEGLGAASPLRQRTGGEGPRGDEAEFPGSHALRARHLDGFLRHPRGDPVRHHHDFGVFQRFRLVQRLFFGYAGRLRNQAAHQAILRFHGHGRVSTLVVRQTRYMEPVAFTGVRHFRDLIRHRLVRLVIFDRPAGMAPRIDLDLAGFGNDYFLGHVAHALIHHQEDRLPVLLGEVEGLDGKVEALLRRIGAQRQNTVIAVRSPAHLHHVGLRGQRGQAGGGSAALHIHEYAGRFGHGGVPDVLHHEREARPRGDRKSLCAAPYRALNGDGGSQLILHLDEGAAHGRNARREPFHHLRGGCNWVSCGKSRTCRQGAFAAGVVAIQEVRAGKDPFWISLHGGLRKLRSPGNTGHTGRNRCISQRLRRGVGDIPWN